MANFDQQIEIEVSASTGDIIVMANSIRQRWNFGFPVIGVYSNSQAGLRRHQFQTYPPDHFQKSKKWSQTELLDKGLNYY